uniref:Shieldin complex subunit 1 n=1 Tax=Pipistrellus kuhlii TaxID=59472 RepID=A0A7J7YAK6_PIPKU|nr:shieldin complex subunit 1 [Pipistrellus kuhlii]
MATPQATPDSQAEESNTLELPLACDLRDYVLWEPSQEAHSEAVSSAEALSIPSSSEVDPVPLRFHHLPPLSCQLQSKLLHLLVRTPCYLVSRVFVQNVYQATRQHCSILTKDKAVQVHAS